MDVAADMLDDGRVPWNRVDAVGQQDDVDAAVGSIQRDVPVNQRRELGHNQAVRTSTLLSAEEFARVAEVLGPCELVNGEIVPMSPGEVQLSKVTLRATFLIESHNRPRQLGHVLTNEAGVIVTRRPDTVRGADVAFIFRTIVCRKTQW